MQQTKIYKQTSIGDELVGYLAADGQILRREQEIVIGRVDAQRRVLRKTMHDERELGYFTVDGYVRSHGLFEGGELGWVDPDGVVVQAGLILGEEEVGRVVGPQQAAAAAALLLIFLPEAAEQNRRAMRQ